MSIISRLSIHIFCRSNRHPFFSNLSIDWCRSIHVFIFRSIFVDRIHTLLKKSAYSHFRGPEHTVRSTKIREIDGGQSGKNPRIPLLRCRALKCERLLALDSVAAFSAGVQDAADRRALSCVRRHGRFKSRRGHYQRRPGRLEGVVNALKRRRGHFQRCRGRLRRRHGRLKVVADACTGVADTPKGVADAEGGVADALKASWTLQKASGALPEVSRTLKEASGTQHSDREREHH